MFVDKLAVYLTSPFAPNGPAKRLTEFDGVRGWAALSVVLFHVFWETLYARAPEMRNIVTGAFMDGGLAVSLFFVLSGEAISAPYFQSKGDRAVRALVLKRYTRLTIPILAATALTWGLAATGNLAIDQSCPVLGREFWICNWLKFPLSFPGMLHYSLVEVYYLHGRDHEWNPFLWTMGYELYGSLMVLAILLYARNLPGLRVALIAAAIYLALGPTRMTQNLSCFLVGLLFADFRARGGFEAVGAPQRRTLLALGLALVLLMAGVANYSGYHEHKNLRAIPILFFIFTLPAANAFFRKPLSQFLGRISFPLYLVQFAVIISPFSAAIGLAERHGVLDRPMAYLIGLSAIALTVALAAAFLPVERFTAFVGGVIARLAQGERPRAAAPATAP